MDHVSKTEQHNYGDLPLSNNDDPLSLDPYSPDPHNRTQRGRLESHREAVAVAMERAAPLYNHDLRHAMFEAAQEIRTSEVEKLKERIAHLENEVAFFKEICE